MLKMAEQKPSTSQLAVRHLPCYPPASAFSGPGHPDAVCLQVAPGLKSEANAEVP